MLLRILSGLVGQEQALSGSVSATHAAAIVTLPAVSGKRIAVTKVAWSYTADPTGGQVAISGPTVAATFDITKGGPGSLPFALQKAPTGTAVTVTLADGGAGIVGRLYVEAVAEA